MKSIFMLFVAGLLIYSCTKQEYAERTDTEVNILGYLQENSDQFSEILKILELTDNDVFIGTYGTYTFFAPTNEAVDMYLSENGYGSVEDVPVEELNNLVRLHLIDQVIETSAFTDGKIPVATMYGQFLTTGAANENGTTKITVNKVAKIQKANVEVGNGIIHVVDHVLPIAKKTLAELIASNDNLSLFNEVVKATGWQERLDQPVTYDEDSIPSYLTVIAQNNEVFHDAGLNSLQDLKEKYSQTGDPTNPEDSLNLYVAYRILPGLKYVADLVTSPSHLTKAPLEVIGVKVKKDTVLINEETFNGVLEKGVVLDRDKSDITASNGVLHQVDGNFNIKLRLPQPVYFDVGDQPEIRQLASVFRKPGNYQTYYPGDLQHIRWGGGLPITYTAHTAGSREAQAYWGDWLEILRLRTGSSSWVEFDTPVIIKGQYKVWITFRTNTRASVAQPLFDGAKLSRTVDFREYRNTELPPRVLESQGYKKSLCGDTWIYNSRFLGIVNVETTGRHVFRLEALTGAGGPSWIDVIEFRPVDMDQLWPKLGGDGQLCTEEDLQPASE
ncbi:fasciclin domain-containing protein [Christiangramia fulva]|nr:fasciclin domain-containing protein [Christiangramia fulva]